MKKPPTNAPAPCATSHIEYRLSYGLSTARTRITRYGMMLLTARILLWMLYSIVSSWFCSPDTWWDEWYHLLVPAVFPAIFVSLVTLLFHFEQFNIQIHYYFLNTAGICILLYLYRFFGTNTRRFKLYRLSFSLVSVSLPLFKNQYYLFASNVQNIYYIRRYTIYLRCYSIYTRL